MPLTVADLQAIIHVDPRNMRQGMERSIGDADRALTRWGGGAAKLLGGIGLAAGGAFAVAVGSAFAQGLDISAGAGKLQAQLGLTEQQAAVSGAAAGDVYASNYGESMEEVQTAIGEVMASMAGMREASEADLESVTRAALTYANVYDLDVAQSIAAANRLMTAGLARDAGHAFDLLTAASTRVAAIHREELLAATNEYSNFFDQVGLGGEEMFSVLARAADQGAIGIDKAADAVAEFTKIVTGDAARAQPVIEGLGLDYEDMATAIIAGGDQAAGAFEQIVQGLESIEDPTTRAQTALELFGTPMEDLSTSTIDDFLGSLGDTEQALADVEGATDRAGETLGGSFAAKLEGLKRQLMGNLVDVVEEEAIPRLQELADELNTRFGPALDDAGGRLADIADLDFDDLAGGVQPFIDLWDQLPESTEESLDSVLNMLDSITTALEGFSEGAGVIWELFGDDMLGYLQTVAESILQVVEGLFMILEGQFSMFGALLTGDWEGMWEGLKTVGSGAMTVLTGLISLPLATIQLAFESLRGAAGRIFGGMWSDVSTRFMNGVATIEAAVAAVPGKIAAKGQQFYTAGSAILGRLVDGITSVPSFAGDIAAGLGATVMGVLNDVIDAMNQAIPNSIPVPGLPDIPLPHNPIPNIPGFATGGRVEGATLAWIGEGREAETVLPDSVLRGLVERGHETGRRKGEREGAPLIGEVNFNQRNGPSSGEVIRDLRHALRVIRFGGVYAGSS
ncbi:MAG: hypothetical protein PIR53_02715 [Nocardioides alkalitolerans]